MKNSKRRLLSSLALVLILILSTTVLSGCYVVNSGKMSKVEGTYMLTHYSGDGDRLTERGITMYMVIRADGTGYYAYKDNNKAARISELRCRFTQDEEEAGKYSYVEIDFHGRGEYEKFAINSRLFESTNLNSQTAVWKPIVWGEVPEIDYYIDVDFTRVSKATDLSYIKENFGDVPQLPLGAMNYDGTYKLVNIIANDKSPVGAEIPKNDFVYYYADFDFVNGNAKIRTMNKSNEITSVATLNDLSIAFENGNYVITAGGKSNMSIVPFLSSQNNLWIEEEFDAGCFTMVFSYLGDLSEEQILDYIEDDVSIYLANKPITE